MRGIVKIDDGAAVHVIPRAEVRYVEVAPLYETPNDGVLPEGEAWVLRYQLVGQGVRSIEWKGDCRPGTLKTKIDVGAYNRIAADAIQTMITRGHRDVHLERRAIDDVFLVRSGLIEEDDQIVLCRKFIAEMALTARQTALGPLDDARLQMLHEIHAAAKDLLLPDWFPLKEDPR